MRPVPVLHVCDKFGVAGSSIHGVSRLFAWWFPRFDRTRFDVSLVGLKAPEPASDKLREAGVDVTHLSRSKFDPRILTDLVRLGRARGARVLHVHGYAAADFGRLAARALGAGLVLHEHFADPRMPAYQGVADRLLSGLTDRAVAVSGSTRDFLVRERFVPADRVRLVWNGAPLGEFAPRPVEESRALRRSFGFEDQTLVIGTISRLSLQKAHHHLLDALPPVFARFPAARLLIVGDGDQMPALREQASRLGLAGSIVFAGHRTDVPALLSALDVFCISSTYEGTPLALFEAMAAGRAIVSTAVDGCAEVLRDGVTGLLAPPANPTALGDALARALGDAGLRRALSTAALDASRQFDIAQCVRQLESIYDEVLAEKGRAA
ncbi:MAG: glycosyltransferase [Vicinamibacteria bacterium]|nr:glycosyltransferase [Vicinamibacteria bacterium]